MTLGCKVWKMSCDVARKCSDKGAYSVFSLYLPLPFSLTFYFPISFAPLTSLSQLPQHPFITHISSLLFTSRLFYSLFFPHLTSHHLTSHHITSLHYASLSILHLHQTHTLPSFLSLPLPILILLFLLHLTSISRTLAFLLFLFHYPRTNLFSMIHVLYFY